MIIDEFSKLLALALIYRLKVPQNKVNTILREISGLANESASLHSINNVLKNHSFGKLHLTQSDLSFAQKIFDDNLKNNIGILSIIDDKYPKYLRLIKDPPPLLFLKGNNRIFDELPGIAVVGARDASKNGAEISRRLGEFLVKNNWVVVSGLALGIDSAAHSGALQGGGRTIAVLAGGLEKASPAKNSRLGQEILERGGAWISEHSVGVPPMKHHFVPRNRIQIGLSAGSIIVEAKVKSGSLSQARFCVSQNRPLFAIIPELDTNELNLNCEGTRYMVRELGAIPLKSKADYGNLLSLIEKEKVFIS